jgi:hypothetical protein
MKLKEVEVLGTPLKLRFSKERDYYLVQIVGPSNPLLYKIANNIVHKSIRDWRGIPTYNGSINIYRSEDLSPEINVFQSREAISYLSLNTDLTRYGILQLINEAEESVALRRLEVEMARTAKDFYRIAVDLKFSESALDLILLLKKGNEL